MSSVPTSRTPSLPVAAVQVPDPSTRAEAIHAEEAARARGIGAVYTVIGFVVGTWVPFLGNEIWLTALTSAVMYLFGATSLAVVLMAWNDDRYSRAVFRVYGAVAVLTSTVILYFLGVYSPTALAVTLGIAFFGRGGDRVGALLICGSAIGLYALLFGLISADIIADRGLFTGDEAGVGARVFMMIMAPFVLAVTLAQALVSQRAFHFAVDRALTATLLAGQRQAQLDELKIELERVGRRGNAGRFTGRSIGEYAVGDLLGAGGGGEVYTAERVDGVRAAIKLLNETHRQDEEAVQRFLREGRLASSLSCSNVVDVYEFGRTDDGHLYIAMEILTGRDLGSMLRNSPTLPLARALRMVRHICKGMEAVHAAGIVHRDIKPNNLFLSEVEGSRSVWKLLDFGVSRLEEGGATLTKAEVIGTPAYMSPEQARGEHVDQRADLYGLAAVLYRALTGRPPLEAPHLPALMLRAAYGRPFRPRDVAPEVPIDLEAFLAISMHPDPAQRYPDAAHFARAFQDACAGNLPANDRARARDVEWAELSNPLGAW